MSNLIVPDSRIVRPFYSRMGKDESFAGMMAFLRKEGFPQKAFALQKLCRDTIVESFETDPVRNLTDSMMKERATLVGTLIVECLIERRWSLQRIQNEILNLTLEKLDAKKKMTRERSSWGVVEDTEMEMSNEDFRTRQESDSESKIIH